MDVEKRRVVEVDSKVECGVDDEVELAETEGMIPPELEIEVLAVPVPVPVPVPVVENVLFCTLVVTARLLLLLGVAVQNPVELPPVLIPIPPDGEPEIEEGKGVVVQVDGSGVVVHVPLAITVIHSVLVQLSVIVIMLVGFAEQSVRDVWSRMRVAEIAEVGGARGVGVGVGDVLVLVLILVLIMIEVPDDDDDDDKIGSLTVETPIERLVDSPSPSPRPIEAESGSKESVAAEIATEALESVVEVETKVLVPVCSAERCGCVNGKTERVDAAESSASSSSSSSSPHELHGQLHRFSCTCSLCIVSGSIGKYQFITTSLHSMNQEIRKKKEITYNLLTRLRNRRNHIRQHGNSADNSKELHIFS